ncbi:class I SAM-dependent methyltransferase [Actinomadura verrucosospora]|uniref:Ubiquinone/menaquinone biosynthesis methyltransferase UbiE n=1 Tax=Actinomadura verrucosospora TaxID=46165 RepID=A0A7D4AQ97_ACTVE|nr:methyltransferase domain-containing protein [Actinomadura verrucosospora]QKG24048.1 ubiquinone/menaquinone biosynthesis methyltransferase UbiE [Actinomadura verrucosospora]
MSDSVRMAEAFGELAGAYDHDHHDAVARALLELAPPAPGDAVADVACGAGAVALQVAARPPGPAPAVLAVDLSPDMIAVGRARAARQGCAGAIDWRAAPAVPLPVPDSSLDLILCASSLHFLGMRALADWRRALRPGGRIGFTLPVASRFRPSGVFAELVAQDLPLPEDAEQACSLATSAGFTDAGARTVTLGSRAVIAATAKNPHPDAV